MNNDQIRIGQRVRLTMDFYVSMRALQVYTREKNENALEYVIHEVTPKRKTVLLRRGNTMWGCSFDQLALCDFLPTNAEERMEYELQVLDELWGREAFMVRLQAVDDYYHEQRAELYANWRTAQDRRREIEFELGILIREHHDDNL